MARFDFAPFRTHYFFLLTTVLAIIAWFIALISQSISTAQFGNRFVGVLWFAIFLQAFLNVGVICTIATDTIHTSRYQLAIFGVMATVFAIEGVEQDIFSTLPAVFMTATGYLILAMVDILWVLYFTSEEDSLMLHIFNRLGSGGLTPPARRGRTRGQSVASSHAGDKEKYALGRGVSSEDVNRDAQRSVVGGASVSRRGTGLARSGTGRSTSSRKSLVGSTHSVAAGEPDQVTSPVDAVPPVPELPPPTPTRPKTPSRPKSTVSRADSTVLGNGAPTESAPSVSEAEPTATPTVDSEYPLRAKARHAYKASPEDPNELSFAKGEILLIEDQEGKWWQAKKLDDTTGIVPSNYLLIL
ncbi:hypothetical protein DFH07DRAFT_578270 [Mycena maculata]|uniref:SH3 domain-containing protein n=1 Tax=Mycena maculata TaxID=230809 RepID=A0AAD7N5T8_9AGAR|nr:hypothetical protein DFH07DRAFT_578270 [Mycena maculata]